VAACVAALGAAGLAASASTASAATVTAAGAKSSASLALWMIPVGLAAAGVGGWLMVRDGDAVPPAKAADAPVSAELAAKPTADAPPPDTHPAPPKRNEVAMRRVTPEVRRELAQRIAVARMRREDGAAARSGHTPALESSGDAPPAPALVGTLSKDDIRTAVREVAPLLTECFEKALPHLTVRHGNIVSHLRFTGEPDVGTVVEAEGLDGEPGFIGDPEFAECWTQTLLSIELPPLEAGGEVKVTYPFELRAGDDDAK
jgi:hypothetical protein